MIFREIEFASKEYLLELQLRDDVLRRPLGLRLSEADCQGGNEQRHFGLFEAVGKLVACVTVVFLSSSETKLRQMAVAQKWRGQGCGRELLLEVERLLAREGYQRFVLHARLSARLFYEKLGYAAVGGEFCEVSLPHIKMEKRLTEKGI